MISRRLFALLSRVPLPILYRTVGVLSWLLGSIFRYRLNVVTNNLETAFPHWSKATLVRERAKFYRHLTTNTLEILATEQLNDDELRQRVTFDNAELLADVSDNFQTSIIVLTLHQGNWEWLLQRAALEYPIPLAPVYKKLHNPAADQFMLGLRSLRNAQPVEMRGVAKNFIRNRRQPRIVAMLADQSPGHRERAHRTTFLHQDTAFYSGAAQLARATGFPVVFADCAPISQGRYHCTLTEITRQPKQMDEGAITEQYARLTEQAIQRSPHSWLWTNRRWKLAPLATLPNN